MRKAAAVLTFAAVLILSSVTGALATQIVISEASGWSWIPCTNINTCAGAATPAVEVDLLAAPIPPWHNPTSGKWISSVSGTASDPFSSIGGGTIQQFSKTIDFGPGWVLTLQVWADDTGAVLIDGVPLTLQNAGSAPNTTQDAACAAGTLGCEDLEFGQFSTASLGLTGLHDLQVRARQHEDFGGTPFGALVEGELATPEPATILLLGSVLATAGVVSRRRFRKSAS